MEPARSAKNMVTRTAETLRKTYLKSYTGVTSNIALYQNVTGEAASVGCPDQTHAVKMHRHHQTDCEKETWQNSWQAVLAALPNSLSYRLRIHGENTSNTLNQQNVLSGETWTAGGNLFQDDHPDAGSEAIRRETRNPSYGPETQSLCLLVNSRDEARSFAGLSLLVVVLLD